MGLLRARWAKYGTGEPVRCKSGRWSKPGTFRKKSMTVYDYALLYVNRILHRL